MNGTPPPVHAAAPAHGRASRVVRSVEAALVSPAATLLMGVVGPAVWLVAGLGEIDRTQRIGFTVFFVASMALLAYHALKRPRSPRASEFLSGALTGATGVSWLSLMPAVFALALAWDRLTTGRPGGIHYALLGGLPFVGTVPFALHAGIARRSAGGRFTRRFVLGVLTPFALAFLAQGALNLRVHLLYRRIVHGDRAEAMAAAETVRRIPHALVTWKPLAAAWQQAKGGDASAPETEQSQRIADAFEHVSGMRPGRGWAYGDF